MIVDFTDDEIDALQDVIKFWIDHLSGLDLQERPHLRGVLVTVTNIGLKLGMEPEEEDDEP